MKQIIKEQVKAQVSKIMPQIKKYVTESLVAEVLVRSTNQPHTSYVVAASLLEFELKKILIDKTEMNKSINRSDIQNNLYNALIEAYNSNKDIFTSYGDVVTLKRGRDDQDKDEEASARSDRGTKRRNGQKEESQARMKKPHLVLLKAPNLVLSINGTFMKRRPEECYDLIENITAHHNNWDTSAQQSESSSSITSSSDTEIAALKAEMAEINKNLMRVLWVNQQVKAVTLNCDTCGGPHSFFDCPTTVGNTQTVCAAGASRITMNLKAMMLRFERSLDVFVLF
nr:hypothetical protein [Tanacetum cinerariifolium]